MGVRRIIQIVGILAWGDALGENSGSGIAGNSGVPGTCGISGKILSGPGWKNGIVPGSLSGSWEFWLFSRITQVCKSRLGEMPWGKIQDLELLEILEFLELLEFLENQKTDWNLPADAQLQKNSDPQFKKKTQKNQHSMSLILPSPLLIPKKSRGDSGICASSHSSRTSGSFLPFPKDLGALPKRISNGEVVEQLQGLGGDRLTAAPVLQVGDAGEEKTWIRGIFLGIVVDFPSFLSPNSTGSSPPPRHGEHKAQKWE